MPAGAKILKNFNLYLDGIGFAGQIDEFQPPNLNIQIEDIRAGGMDAPVGVDMGMEKLEASFTSNSLDVAMLKQFGNQVALVARGAVQSIDGLVEAVTVTMNGLVKMKEYGAWQPGQKATVSVTLDLRYYKYEQGGEILDEIDVLNMLRIVNGIDQTQEIRNAIGQ